LGVPEGGYALVFEFGLIPGGSKGGVSGVGLDGPAGVEIKKLELGVAGVLADGEVDRRGEDAAAGAVGGARGGWKEKVEARERMEAPLT